MARNHIAHAAVVALVAAQTPIVVPWPTPSNSPLNVTMGYGTVNSTGTRFNWYISILDDLSRFSVQLPATGCSTRNTTTSTSNLHGCQVAVNAGFFSFSAPYCMGELVINSTVQHWDGDGDAMFSVTANKQSVVGTLTQDQVKSMGVTHGVNGFGVIVRDGKVYKPGVERAKARVRAVKSARGEALHLRAPGAEEVAPRTVVGLDAQGRLLLVAVDGVEALYLGVTMDEIAELMTGAAGFPFKAVHAINLDGGGSTAMTYSAGAWPTSGPAVIYNRPTSTDTGPIVERDVTSIMCIAGQ